MTTSDNIPGGALGPSGPNGVRTPGVPSTETRWAGVHSTEETRRRRRRAGLWESLFPEIPIDADWQIRALGLGVGALVFSAIMGWGPAGKWLDGLNFAKHSSTTVAEPSGGSKAVLPSVAAAAAVIAPVLTTAPATSMVPVTTVPIATIPATTSSPATLAPTTQEVATEPETSQPSVETSPALSIDTALAPVTVDTLPGTSLSEDLKLYFPVGRATLDAQGQAALDKVVERLKGVPDGSKIEIVGFASADGNAAKNATLSNDRANFVLDQLRARLNAKNFSFAAEGRGVTPESQPELARRADVRLVP